jgi:hypothetical protein
MRELRSYWHGGSTASMMKGIFAAGHSTMSFFATRHHLILPLLLDTF